MKLRRHQLAYLSADGWRELLRRSADGRPAPLLETWALRGWPLVVTRQQQAQEPADIVLGWPTPPGAGCTRRSLQVLPEWVGWFDEFPVVGDVRPLLPQRVRAAFDALGHGLWQLGSRAHVFGSYGWQHLTGLDYLRAASDLDLWLPVRELEQADAVVRLLQACEPRSPRIDGELMFPDGAAVAWREYAAWRAGRPGGLLVKRVDSVSVEDAIALPAWCEVLAA